MALRVEEYVSNPRRAPRIPARCRVTVTYRGSAWQGVTEDLGPGGCQIVSPRPVAEGAQLHLVIADERVPQPLVVDGRVAWVTPVPPHRMGVAFAKGAASAWFDRLVAAEPGLASAMRRVPDRLPLDAVVYLAEPPRYVVDFDAEELAMLRAIGDGARLSEVRGRLGAVWESAQRAVFALLTRRAVTLSRAAAVPSGRWRKVLLEAETSLAAESLGRPGGTEMHFHSQVEPPPKLPRPAPAATAAERAAARGGEQDAIPVPEDPGPLEIEHGIPDDARAEPPAPGPPAPPAAAAPPREAPPAHAPPRPPPAPASSRGPARPGQGRPPEAQVLLDQARAQVEAGNVASALALLRQALAKSPRDAEIGGLIGQLAFKDRKVE